MSTPTNNPRRIGVLLGPGLFVVMLAFGDIQTVMSLAAWRAAAGAVWLAVWWSTEAAPLPVTALLPLVLFAPLDLATSRQAAAAYAHPTIFLFLGGFMMALAIERWSLHRRIALAVLSRTGTDPDRLIGGFMLVSALLSMWMTNTSTTMMLLPIALSVATVMRENLPDSSESEQQRFAIGLLLGVAFAASIGGLSTLIGTPPNALLVAYLAEQHSLDISFARWMLIGIPVTALLLPLAWWLLTRRLFPVTFRTTPAVAEHLDELRAAQGAMSTAERRIAVLFGLMVASWLLRRPLQAWLGLPGLNDTMIAIAAAIALFIVPSGDNSQPRLMTWQLTERLPWGVLVLFGGGLSLAAVVDRSGLAQWLGESLVPLNALGIGVLILAAVAMTIFLTEFTSNLATTATLLPVMGAIALQADLAPLLLTVPVTIAASCAFMLPVATAPNAIVFSTGTIRIGDMVRAGVWLNLIAVVLIWLIGLYAAPALL